MSSVKRMNKGEAIAEANLRLERGNLTNSNTSFSSLNRKGPVWWLNIRPEKLTREHYVLLAGSSNLVLLHVPANHIRAPENMFRVRGDNGALDIAISANPSDNYLCDRYGTKYDFRQHARHTWELSRDLPNLPRT